MEIIGISSLLISEWHPTKNYDKKITDFSLGSGKIVWWLGNCGHEWFSEYRARIKLGKGCPYCSNRKILQGFNDLATTHPELLKEWDYSSNNILPTDVSYGSKNKVNWICSKGHIWNTSINNRAGKKPTGCAICSSKVVLKGFNDFASRYPDKVRFWNYIRNAPLKPEEVTSKTAQKVWWKCDLNHEWEANISDIAQERGCPYCSGKKVLAGFNDLESKKYLLSLEWHPTRNDNLKPSQVTSFSDKKVWWKCDKGHSYFSDIKNRSLGNGCPYCANKKVLVGFNDLGTINPTVSLEWHPTKNKPLTPQDFTPGSGKIVWWRCNKSNHIWKTSIEARRRTACPECNYASYVSKAEKEIYDYLIKYDLDVKTSVRNLLKFRKEIDLYIPSRKVGIEFNGLYWHSEKFQDKDYHFAKWEEAKTLGIDLIQIWEDDWIHRKQAVLQSLINKIIPEKINVLNNNSIKVHLTNEIKDISLYLNPYLNTEKYSDSLFLKVSDCDKVYSLFELKHLNDETLIIINNRVLIGEFLFSFSLIKDFLVKNYSNIKTLIIREENSFKFLLNKTSFYKLENNKENFLQNYFINRTYRTNITPKTKSLDGIWDSGSTDWVLKEF